MARRRRTASGILPVEQTALRQEVGALFVERGLDLPAERVECTSILTMRALLLQTDMVALLPGLVLRDDERLAPLPVDLLPVGRTVGTTEAAHRTRTPAVLALLDHPEAEAGVLRETLKGPQQGRPAGPRKISGHRRQPDGRSRVVWG